MYQRILFFLFIYIFACMHDASLWCHGIIHGHMGMQLFLLCKQACMHLMLDMTQKSKEILWY
jgi:hypothetical protein